MTTVELANGTTFEGYVGDISTYLAVSVTPSVALEHFSLLLDPANLETITYHYGAFKDVYRGAFVVSSIEPRLSESKVIIWIAKPENATIERYVPTVPTEYL